MLLHIQGISSVDIAGVQFRQKINSLLIKGVNVSVADFTIKGIIADKQMNAVDIFSRLRISMFLGKVESVIFLQSLVECRDHIHYLACHPHVLSVVV